MDTRQMRYFVALAETLHFGHAAARMNMTQPPFSRQIANLERDLGVRLVERTSRQVALTAAGKRFLETSRAVLAQFEDACREARRVAEGQTGELRFGFMMHAANQFVPQIVSRYTQIRPEVRLILTETTPIDIEDRLITGALDAAVTFAGRALPQLDSLPIHADRLCLVMPPGHRLEALAEIRPGDLRDEGLIAAPANVVPILRAAIHDFFAADGVLPQFRFEPLLQNTILRLVAAGLGVALVPRFICGPRTPDLVTRPLVNAPRLDLVLKTPRRLDNPAVPPLLDLVRSGDFGNPGS